MSAMERHDKLSFTPRSMVGIFIIVIGVVLVLDQFHIVSASALQPYWPLGVIAIGAVLFLQGRAQGGRGVNGAIAMGIGVWLLVNTLGVARVHFWDLFGPLLLIGIGWALVKQRGSWHPSARSTPETNGHMAVFAVLSGVKRASTASQFKGEEGLSPAGILGAVEKRFDTGYVDEPKVKEIIVSKNEAGNWTMTADYEKTVPMFANLYLLLVFKTTVAIN